MVVGATSVRCSRLIAITLLLLTLASFSSNLASVSASPPYSWSSPSKVNVYPGSDLLPSILQASNGTQWVAWQSNRFNTATPQKYDILYQTDFPNGTWRPVQRLTTSGYNAGPALAQLSNNTILLFWSQLVGHSFQIFDKRFNANLLGVGSWSVAAQVTQTTLNDTQSSAAVGSDGRLWLVWTRANSTCSITCTARQQLFYKTLSGNVWSGEIQLTVDSNQNFGSSVLVGRDGIVRVVWSKGVPTSIYQLYYKTYNGIAWSSETQIVSSSSTDERPSLIQDRNGTLWTFWGRLIVLSTTENFVLYNKFSTDNGNTWSVESQMNGGGSSTTDNKMPSAIQSSSNNTIWLVYVSNQLSDDDIWMLKSTQISPVHHVTISLLTTTSHFQYPGGLVSILQPADVTISVTASNIGDFAETVSVTLSVTNTTTINLGTQSITLFSGVSGSLQYNWNTTTAKPARYTFKASLAPIPGETQGNSGDNSMSVKNLVHILPLGDVDQDGSVTITDVGVVFYNYGFAPPSPRYNPFADIDGNGIIDLLDIGVVSRNYGIFT